MALNIRAQPLLRVWRASDNNMASHERLQCFTRTWQTANNAQIVYGVRRFSVTRADRAAPRASQIKMPQMKGKAQRSPTMIMKEQMETMEMPDDVGLLPNTFVAPIVANRPPWTFSLEDRLGLKSRRMSWEWKRIKSRAKDIAMLGVTKFYLVLDRPKSEARNMTWPQWLRYKTSGWYDLETAKVPAIAKTLYEEMYTRLASGEIDAMRPRLGENIFSNLQGRVKGRSQNVRVDWKLHKYISQPKLVSYKTTLTSQNMARSHEHDLLQQAVVRIRSVQSLQQTVKTPRTKTKAGQKEVAKVEQPDAPEREVIEYLVVQKMTRKGKQGEWLIWGTTDETTMDKLEAQDLKDRGLA